MEARPKDQTIYETTNAALAAYLYNLGIKFLEASVDSNKAKPTVTLRFLDTKNNCRDLEYIYMKSPEKLHNEIYRFFLTEIHKKLRGE
jgi:hypothetical protein